MPVKKILDNNVLSYAYKGKDDYRATGCSISSVTALEFLQAYVKDSDTEYAYYPRLLGGLRGVTGPEADAYYKSHPESMIRNRCDRISFYFRSDLQIIEYGNFAISQMINSGAADTFEFCIRPQKRSIRAKLMEKFDYLMTEKIECIPLSTYASELGCEYLKSFQKFQNIKANKFRNSFHDLLIVAMADEHDSLLYSKDKEMLKFAAKVGIGEFKSEAPFASVDFSSRENEFHKKRELNGYINSGWKVQQNKK